MIVEYVKGNLVETALPVIVHGCNAQGVMGSGVARAIRETFPWAYQSYITHHKFFGHKLGDAPFLHGENKVIVNAITQDKYGYDGKRYVSYDAIAECFRKIERVCVKREWEHIAMPKIGAGLGGGDWNVIEAIVNSELKVTKATVYEL